MVRRFVEHALETLDEERAAFVPLHRLSADVEGTVRGIYGRFGWRPGPGMEEALERRSAASRRHRSAHRYDLDAYGLDTAGLERTFRVLYRTFHIPTGSPPGAAPAGDPASRPSPGS
jgi:hypothetical protein